MGGSFCDTGKEFGKIVMIKPNVDVIIPIYKPGKDLYVLLDALLSQTVAVNKIILANTEEKYFDELTYGTLFQEKYAKYVDVFHLSKREFDHGGTRHRAVEKSEADIFVMMTQDAMPADNRLLENLLAPLSQEKTAVSYARQLPAKGCNEAEAYTRRFNYPEESRVKTLSDLPTLGIKTYFCSNVCAAYKRSIYEVSGGFCRHTIFNEDMIYAAGVVKKGYAIAYAADAAVIHSHNYTNRQQFQRNFDLGVSQADHPEIFKGVPSEKEGKRMVRQTGAYLWHHKKSLIFHFYLQCAFKYAGYLCGKHYRSLPWFVIKRFTSNKEYWRR